MRNNQPVTQREYPFPKGATLMSVTDAKGRIRLANSAFVTVSGFSRDDLIGQAHNIVRHPDMPREAFADMWKTLKAGIPWTGIVKNRRADGDHYWVRANATPVQRDGRVLGYVSVRTQPTRAEVAAAETLYKKMRAGAHGSGIELGVIVRTGVFRWLSLGRTASVRLRMLACLFLALGPAAVAAVLLAMPMQSAVMIAVALCGGMLLAAGFAEIQVAGPLRRLLRHALLAAGGQSAVVNEFQRTDEIGLLLRAVNQMSGNQKTLIDDVIAQTDGLHHASSEIAAGNMNLSARTEQQSSNLEQTAASMEQMASAVQATSTTARQANELATSACQAASNGGEVVGRVTAKMEEISTASRKIAEIISVIDGIAFQTNILALNAAVEAARAGEQGRGFAVVAAEVRSLAQRSAMAAREIKVLIANSVDSVEAGSRSVHGAEEAMSEIVHQVQRVAELIGEIATSINQQQAGIAQVNQAVTHLDEVTHQNAALVELTAAAAESVSKQADSLNEVVSTFRFAEV